MGTQAKATRCLSPSITLRRSAQNGATGAAGMMMHIADTFNATSYVSMTERVYDDIKKLLLTAGHRIILQVTACNIFCV
jgi:hypothetical protein